MADHPAEHDTLLPLVNGAPAAPQQNAPPIATPPPPAAKPRLRSSNLTHEQKRLICIHAKQNPAITQTQLGQWAKVRFALATTPSQSSISHTLKRKHNFEHMKSEELASKRMRSVKFPDLDIALANWFLYCQARQIKVQGDEIKAKAHLFFEMMALSSRRSVTTAQDSNAPPQFSNGWLHSFQSRHGFSRSPNTQGSIELPVITTRSEFQTAIEGIAPWDIYWMDETSLFYSMSPDEMETIGSEYNSYGQVYGAKRMTIAFCTNADASDMPDPFFVCTEPPVPAATAVSMGFQYAYNKNAWLSPTVFREWLLALDWRMHEENRHIVLFLDAYTSHQVKKMMLKNVSVRFVVAPPSHYPTNGSNSESLFSSIENAVFSAVKLRYRLVFLSHVLDRRDHQQDDMNYGATPLEAIQWVLRCWRQLPKVIITQSFAEMGVFMASSTHDSTAFVSVDPQVEEKKIEAQILVLLKRTKFSKLPSEFVNPTAERVCDDVELTDQDFVDTAVNAMLVGNVPGSDVTGEVSRKAARARATKKVETSGSPNSSSIPQNGGAVLPNDRPQVMVSLRATKTPLDRSLLQQPREDDPQSVAASAATSDEEWQAWTASQSRSKTSDDVQALQRVIRLATEMSAEPSTILDLNRMLFDVTQTQALSGTLQQDLSKDETVLQSTGVCRFTFATPTKHAI
ncbi:Ars binding protein 1, partial [Globisporangium splendens]